MATRSLGVLTLDLVARLGGFESNLDRASGKVKSTAKDMEAAARVVDKYILSLGAAAVALAGTAAAMAVSSAKSMDATAKMAEQIGVTTEALTGLRFAAQQYADVSDKTFDMAMRRMTRRIEEAAQGAGGAKNALDALGLSAQQLSSLTPDKQFLALADAIQKTDSQAARLRYTMAVFDTEGMPLVAALQRGSAEMERGMEVARRYGVVLSTEAAQAAGEFSDNMDALQFAAAGFKQQVAEAVLPTLVSVTNALREFGESAGPVGEKVEAALKVAGAAAAAVGGIFASRLIASLYASVAAWTVATAAAIKHQATMAGLAASIAGSSTVIASASAAAAGGLAALSRVGSIALGVLGGPVGLVATVGLTAAGFLAMGGSAKSASMDIDSLTNSMESLNAEQLAFRMQQAEERLEEAQGKAADLSSALAAVERDYHALSAQLGRGVDAAGLENIKKTLVQLRSELADANQDVAKVEAAIAKLGDASRAAAGDVATLNDSLVQTNEAGAKYLEQLGRRALLAGATTELERVNRLIKAGELVYEDGGKAAREFAATIDRFSKSAGGARKPTRDLGSEMQSLADTFLPANKALSDLHKNLALLEKAQKAGKVSSADYATALQNINLAYAEQVESLLPEHIKTAREMADQAEEQLKQLELQVAHFGLLDSAVMDLARAETEAAIAKLEVTRATEIANKADAERIRLINEEIAALRRIAAAQGQSAGQHRILEAKQAQQDLFEEGQRAAEDLERSLTDALMRGFEDGKGFAENFRDTLRNMFNTLVLRPIIQPIAQSMAGSIMSAFGLPGAGQAGQSGGIGNLLGGNLFGNFGGGVGQLAQNVGHSLWEAGFKDVGSALADNAYKIGEVANIAGDVLGYGKAIFDVTQGNWGSAAGTAIGQFAGGPIGAAIGSMIGGMLDEAFKGETRFGGSFALERGGSTYYEGGPSGGVDSAATQFADALLSNAGASIQAAFAAVGSKAIVDRLMVGFESSEKGRGGTQSAGSLLLDGQVIHFGEVGKGTGHGGASGSIEDMMRDAEIDVYQMAIKAWQAASGEFPAIMRDKLMSVSADSLGLEGAQSFIQEFVMLAQQLGMLSDALSALPFVPTIAATFDFAAALAEAAGGAENAAAALGSFYTNFYTETERAAWLTEQLTAQFAELGMTLPQTRYEFRALVEANMALGEAGAQTVAALLGMESALSSLLPAFDAITSATGSLDSAFEASLAAAQSLARESQRLLGVRTAGGNLIDRIDSALGRSPMYAMQREAELWAALQTASYEQQIALAGELTDMTLSRYQIEVDGISRVRDISRTLRDYLASLSTSDLAPTNLATKVSEAERQLNEAVAAARAGDETALQQVQGLTQNALELWRRYGASGDAYQDAYYRITGMVGDLADSAQSDAERQLAVSSDSLAQLEQLRGIAQTATSAIDQQYQQSLAALAQETELLSSLGQDTGRLHEIADLLGGMPAQIAAQLQPILAAAMGSTVAQWYADAGYGAGDAEGNAYWSSQLGKNPAGQVQEDFLASVVTGWYAGQGRAPDPQGLDYWVNEALNIGAQQAYEDFLASARIDGSHRNGLWSVPRDGYLAELHREEAVLPAVEARAWRSSQSSGPSNAEVVAELKALREEVKMLRQVTGSGLAASVDATRQSGDTVADAFSKRNWEREIA